MASENINALECNIDKYRVNLTTEFKYLSPQRLIKENKQSLNKLSSYLSDKKRKGNGKEYTHTSMGGKIIFPGKFNIEYKSNDNTKGKTKISEEDFLELYKNAVKTGEEICITEKHLDNISPLIIDLDFRFNNEYDPITMDSGEITYFPNEFLVDISNMYAKCIMAFVDIKEFTMYVQKRGYISEEPGKSYAKEGIHMIAPDVVVEPIVQYKIREYIIAKINDLISKYFEEDVVLNTPENIVDESIIEKNCWLMYGSTKPKLPSYKVVSKINYVKGEKRIITATSEFPDEDDTIYVKMFSIRNKSVLSPIREKYVGMFEKEKDMRNVFKNNDILNTDIPNKESVTADEKTFKLATILTFILSPERAENYDSWSRVCWCLRNIDDRLYDTWHQFSQKCPEKYDKDKCDKMWKYAKTGKLTIGSLKLWASQDNITEYRRIMGFYGSEFIDEGMKHTQTGIAKLMHMLYGERHVCSSIKDNKWYEFRNHRWVPSDSGYSLHNMIDKEIVSIICANIGLNINKNNRVAGENNINGSVINKIQNMSEIIKKLGSNTFKKGLMEQCRNIFYVEDFEELLDKNGSLLCFENGVFDLENFVFRAGRPDDYISLTTKRDYIEDNSKKALLEQKELMAFLHQIFPNKEIFEYSLTKIALSLDGTINQEHFNLWTGTGANGKSKLVELIHTILGNYYQSPSVTLVTREKPSSEKANPELYNLKGCRFVSLNEPSKKDKLNTGVVKELTGGDSMSARTLWGKPIIFKPQCDFFYLCNKMPEIEDVEGGIVRRIKVVHFPSKFLDAPNPKNPLQFKKIYNIEKKFDKWAPHFIRLLLTYLYKYKQDPESFVEPYDVKNATEKYLNSHDTIKSFISENVESINENELKELTAIESVITIEEIKRGVSEYCVTNEIPQKKMPLKEMVDHIIPILGKPIISNKKYVWYGYRINREEEDLETLVKKHIQNTKNNNNEETISKIKTECVIDSLITTNSDLLKPKENKMISPRDIASSSSSSYSSSSSIVSVDQHFISEDPFKYM